MTNPDWDAIRTLAAELGAKAKAAGLRLSSAESCTGGLIAGAITEIAGSSNWFDEAFITYANAAKMRRLGVSEESLARFGAVSEAVVREMAEGARVASGADLAVASSGIAGPDGGSPEKPVGTVWLAWAGPDGTQARCVHFQGDRQDVRLQAVFTALEGLLQKIP
ncbi:CinA family protein [Gallaecimonas kandeliae]|uniref:CinA family protein n=1 Tax=Gallaecimonas kandeliae TaxID=3029055 RepID=UPI00264932DA|nr:CinA family protein [Gallaecimonas kandeliae]WKE66458.1 CinA family protein [Gallaecimonas kandeliae]